MTSKHTNDRDRLGGFETRLLGELKSVVAQRTAQRKAERSALAHARTPLWRRTRVVSVASAGALAIGAAIGLPLVGGETTAPPASAAYEVTANDDGTVTVTIYRFRDADGLEDKLEEHGVNADVSYTPADKRCHPGRYQLADKQHRVGVDMTGHWSFTVRPSDFADDETLVITHDRVGALPPAGVRPGFAFDGSLTETAVGPVGECVLEDDPNYPLRPKRVDGHLTYEIPMVR
jgi:hypothetical protein